MPRTLRLTGLKFGWLVWVWLVWSGGVVCAQQPPTQPMLRLETGIHTATINQIGVDAANRYLVTGSDDKTIRVWDLEGGRLVKVLRPPIDSGDEGKIYAVAISPDGSLVAAGGWTGGDWEKQSSIYLFDRASGRLVRRIGGLPNVIYRLAYSPDGSRLAAVLGGQNGLRLFRASDGVELWKDSAYGNGSYGVDFDRSGRVATTCDDGYIRLYDGAGRLLAKTATSGGKEPSRVKFSPDGRRVAVGFADTTNVEVLSGSDLSRLYQPDTSGVTNGNLRSVAWSVDGQSLYAAGRWNTVGNYPIRRWNDGGRGSWNDIGKITKSTIELILSLEDNDIPVANGTIIDLIPLTEGGLAYASSETTWGVVPASGEVTRRVEATIGDFRDLLNNFQTDATGSRVKFGYQSGGISPAGFNVTERRLESDPGDLPVSPRTTAPGIEVTDWEVTVSPKLNGTPLSLKQYERSQSLAIAPDGKSFVLGADWSLRCFDTAGREQWKKPVPSVVWSVNITGNGKLVLAAYADGTIRWHRLSDGLEVLAFFPHADRKRWVAWTPSGYFDASAGGDDLIGWHINNGREAAADFFSVGQFRGVYYRPDVIARVLTTLDEEVALRQANEETGRKQQAADVIRQRPPVVEIVSPGDNATVETSTVAIRYRLRNPSGEPITQVKVLVDGRPVSVERGQKVASAETGEVRVTIPEQNCQVALIAENQYTASEPAMVSLRWNARPTSVSNAGLGADLLKPNLYILAIGVSRYANAELRLNFPAKDARDFVAAMERQKGGLYRNITVKLLTDELATSDAIREGLAWIEQQTTSRDVAMVFLAGHGENDTLQRYYYLPYNANPDKLASTCVKFTDIKDTVEVLAGKALFFVDTCHSGNVMGTPQRRGMPDVTGMINDLASAENGAVVFSASTGRQSSLEDTAWNNGAFTKALVEGLMGRADLFKNGKITISTLDAFITERVKELTKGRQTPTTIKPKTIPDYPIAVNR